jgi:hypothetical protein
MRPNACACVFREAVLIVSLLDCEIVAPPTVAVPSMRLGMTNVKTNSKLGGVSL